MKNQNHGASEHDNEYQANGDGNSGFVVPEPDGVTSGHPVGNGSPASATGTPMLAAEALARRAGLCRATVHGGRMVSNCGG